MTRPPAARLAELYETLESVYGYQGWWPLGSRAGLAGYDAEGYRLSPGIATMLDDRDRTEIAIGAVLTQNTAWANARRALESLREHGALTAARLARLSREELAGMIRSSGAFNQKARKAKVLMAYLAAFTGNGRDGSPRAAERGKQTLVPTRDGLLDLWGIGPETADSILLYAYDVATFVVDAYARRTLGRLGIVGGEEGYDRIQRLLHEALPRDTELYGEFHALFVRHGRAFCRKKPLCSECPLRGTCAFGKPA